MTPGEQLETALQSPEPVAALRAVVLDLHRQGYSRPAIQSLLENLVIELRERIGEPGTDEEAVLDVLDALAGWCHPSARLLPD